MVRGNLPASKLRGSRAEESARRVGGKENFLVGNGGRPPLPANAGGGGGRGGAGDGDRKRMHGWKFEGEPQFKGLSQQCGRRPLVIGGFTGSSTRLPMRVLQRAGVYMGPEELISSDADTLAWIRSMGGKSIHNQITAILDKTGSPAYEIEDIADASLQADIDAEYEVRVGRIVVAWAPGMANGRDFICHLHVRALGQGVHFTPRLFMCRRCSVTFGTTIWELRFLPPLRFGLHGPICHFSCCGCELFRIFMQDLCLCTSCTSCSGY